jgi:hypothetical protein
MGERPRSEVVSRPLPTHCRRLRTGYREAMRRDLLALSIISCFCLGGCDWSRLMLPYKATTTAEALNAIQRCGASPDGISWRVTKDGAFAFGRRSAAAPPIADRQSECLLKWAKDTGVEVRFIGWERDAG